MKRTATAHLSRKVLTVTAMAAMLTSGALLNTGTAAATTHQADNCTAAVNGNIGDVVSVPGSSLKSLVEAGAKEAGTLALPKLAAKDIERAGALNVGQVPNAAAGSVGGPAIADATVEALKSSWNLGLDRQKTLDTIHNKVAGSCGIGVTAANFAQPTSPNTPTPDNPGNGGGPTGAPTSTSPGGGGGLPITTIPGSGSGSTRVPPRDYSGIPAATPGVPALGVPAPPPGMRYPAPGLLPGVPQPQAGVLGGTPQQQPAPAEADVRNAGNADSVAAPGGSPGTVQLPMLLAVVALAGVTSALVRTWVVRKA